MSREQTIRVVSSGLTNPMMFNDVNANGEVTPFDALLIINYLRRNRPQTSIPVGPDERGPNFYDTNDSGEVNVLDALAVINEVRRNRLLGEGELVTASVAPIAQSEPIFVDTVTTVTPEVVLPATESEAPIADFGSDELGDADSDAWLDAIATDRDDTQSESGVDSVLADWNVETF